MISFDDYIQSFVEPISTSSTLHLLKNLRVQFDLEIEEITYGDLEKWGFGSRGDLQHDSGKFFKISGAKVEDKTSGHVEYQPVIDQPEIGILGLLFCSKPMLKFYLQAKIEPGNIENVQYSPTVQATKSNYSGVHNGKRVDFIDYFNDESKSVIKRQNQSEHGYKFYRKRNDNVLSCVEAEDDVEEKRKFRWLSLSEIRFLLSQPHCVNMDTRSVLCSFFPGEGVSHDDLIEVVRNYDFTDIEKDLFVSSLVNNVFFKDLSELTAWMTGKKERKKFVSEMIPLKDLYSKGWKRTEEALYSEDDPSFEQVNLRVFCSSREVLGWTQPIVKDNFPKIYAFLFVKIREVIHVIVKFTEEKFSYNGGEIGPTISGESADANVEETLAREFAVTADSFEVLYDVFQSEEGGRFYKQKNRYVLAMSNEAVQWNEDSYMPMTLFQIRKLMDNECFANIECRTLTTISSFFWDSKRETL